jgi:hypothetical protein
MIEAGRSNSLRGKSLSEPLFKRAALQYDHHFVTHIKGSPKIIGSIFSDSKDFPHMSCYDKCCPKVVITKLFQSVTVSQSEQEILLNCIVRKCSWWRLTYTNLFLKIINHFCNVSYSLSYTTVLDLIS